MKPKLAASIPLSVPHMAGNEAAYVRECIETNWVSYVGPFVERFERELAQAFGAQYAVATSSGTAALHLALLIAGVERDTEVVMPAITFVAPANAVRYCGAWPTLFDISAADWQPDLNQAADFLHNGCARRNGALFNKTTGRRISALLPVNLLGDVCDIDGFAALAAEFDLPLIEDAAECVGATYKGRGVAAPSPLDASRRHVATSFNGNKIVTTGGGGALLYNDSALAQRAKHLSTTAKTRPLEFFHDEVGYNYRLTNLCAALGCAQLEQLPEFVQIKQRTAAYYEAAFSNLRGVHPHPKSPYGNPIYWLYTIALDQPCMPVVRKLNEAGVGCRPLWTPVHKLPAFAGCHLHSAKVSEDLWSRAISLPSSVGISHEELDYVIDRLKAGLAN